MTTTVYTVTIEEDDGTEIDIYTRQFETKKAALDLAREEVKWESANRVQVTAPDGSIIFDELGDFRA